MQGISDGAAQLSRDEGKLSRVQATLYITVAQKESAGLRYRQTRGSHPGTPGTGRSSAYWAYATKKTMGYRRTDECKYV